MDQNELRPSGADLAIMCTLDAERASSQLLEWTDLQERTVQAIGIPDGARLTFPAALAADIEELVERERECCAFLTIDTRIDDDLVVLSITSANADALPVIEMLAGITNK
jgi:hypothetical protein